MPNENVVRLVGGDSAGVLIQEGDYGHQYREGYQFERPKRPIYKPDPDAFIGAETIPLETELEVYQVHNFTSDGHQLLFAAPKGWTAVDIQMELWRHYSGHEELQVETDADDRGASGGGAGSDGPRSTGAGAGGQGQHD